MAHNKDTGYTVMASNKDTGYTVMASNKDTDWTRSQASPIFLFFSLHLKQNKTKKKNVMIVYVLCTFHSVLATIV